MKKVMAIALSTGTFLILLSIWTNFQAWDEAELFLFIGMGCEVIALLAYIAHRIIIWELSKQRKVSVLAILTGACMVFGAALSSFWRWPFAFLVLLIGLGVEAVAMFSYFVFPGE